MNSYRIPPPWPNSPSINACTSQYHNTHQLISPLDFHFVQACLISCYPPSQLTVLNQSNSVRSTAIVQNAHYSRLLHYRRYIAQRTLGEP
jgi:hypothetical protein